MADTSSPSYHGANLSSNHVTTPGSLLSVLPALQLSGPW